MSRALGEAHRQYINFINAWPMDRSFISEPVRVGRHGRVTLEVSTVSYVSLNPVRAGLVFRAEDWAWSSVRAHLAGKDDSLVSVRHVLDRWPTFRDLLLENYEKEFTTLRNAEDIGRPLGTADFVTELERRLGRPIARRAPGRKRAVIPVGEQLNLLQYVSRHRISPSVNLICALGADDLPVAS
jgi:putative transposase